MFKQNIIDPYSPRTLDDVNISAALLKLDSTSRYQNRVNVWSSSDMVFWAERLDLEIRGQRAQGQNFNMLLQISPPKYCICNINFIVINVKHPSSSVIVISLLPSLPALPTSLTQITQSNCHRHSSPVSCCRKLWEWKWLIMLRLISVPSYYYFEGTLESL